MRYEIKRVHGYKTFRVYDTVRNDWDGPAMFSISEAEEHRDYMEKYNGTLK